MCENVNKTSTKNEKMMLLPNFFIPGDFLVKVHSIIASEELRNMFKTKNYWTEWSEQASKRVIYVCAEATNEILVHK